MTIFPIDSSHIISRTFISTGSCPYNDRCVFLHDPRVLSNRVVMKARLRKSKEDLCQDSLFWPTMPRREVVGRLDCRNRKCHHILIIFIFVFVLFFFFHFSSISLISLHFTSLFFFILLYFCIFHLIATSPCYSSDTVPAIAQRYIVPHPSGTVGSAREMRNNNAVYSLWSYFLDFLVSDPASVIRIPRLVIPPDANDIVNRHTGRRRLNLFISISKGKTAEACM